VATTPTVSLLTRARSGDANALGELLLGFGPRLLALIRVRLGAQLRREIDSQDVLQETLVRAIERFDQFRGADREGLASWLAAIAANEIRDRGEFFRRLKRDVRLRESWRSGFDPVASRVVSEASRIALEERLVRLERALERLTPDHREVIVLRRFEELSFADIGIRMGRSEEASRKLLARALAALTEVVRRLGAPRGEAHGQ